MKLGEGRHYRLIHRTTYDYPAPVTSSHGRALLQPRNGGGQQVHQSQLRVDPAEKVRSERRDFHGNTAVYFQVQHEHRQLIVEAHSLVSVHRRRADPAHLPQTTWEAAAAATSSVLEAPTAHAGSPSAAFAVAEARFASPLVPILPQLRDYALASFRSGRALSATVLDLMHRIYTDFAYVSGATDVDTPLVDVLQGRRGVCQDFTHVLIGAARSMGLAARYVSGYIETEPPPGQPKLQGADASHAWASVWLPGGGWLQLDPTNDQLIDERYVVLGWGRDFTDVSPLRGVVYSEAAAPGPRVEVDLQQLQPDEMRAALAQAQD